MKVEQAILYNRNYLMGIAMLLVLLYHFTCWIGFRKLLLPFNWGFIGVDIFLFLSAIGLGFSASKHKYKDFLRRRFIRIMPLYIFAAIVDSILFHFTHNETLSLWDWICNITSLSYYGVGGYVRDWYLSSLLLLYITFPILSCFVNKCKHGGGVISTFIVALIIVSILKCHFNTIALSAEFLFSYLEFMYIIRCHPIMITS